MAPRPVRKAVLPVAGLGTRFLPASKAVPKEMLTVVDKPVIEYAIDEAREAGIEEFVFVTGRGKAAIEDHFDHIYELEATLEQRGKKGELRGLLDEIPVTGSMLFTRQQKPLGLGHAVWCARLAIGNEPFAVLLPDDVMAGKPGALKQMVDVYNRVGGCIVAAEEVPRERTNRYGIIDPGPTDGVLTEVIGVIEKPAPEKAPSTLGVIGRYILQPEVFAELDQMTVGTGGEIQLTDSMARLIGHMPFHALKTTCARYDCGDKFGFVQANIAMALLRPDVGPVITSFLKKLSLD